MIDADLSSLSLKMLLKKTCSKTAIVENSCLIFLVTEYLNVHYFTHIDYYQVTFDHLVH